ncbi:hypothetical protein BHU72_04675 [Desulfuribacillus stibiiarsenatis]|uniref:Uncharacterized protein n=1 Tax=Desulfuribacillus stibiiarsenatis TaxID=1390249 RepID=A0A1E5L5T0_9FIRM|nr:hypothetical protein [Desulfuribacillus stibiiarsenatis]OEH85388.1 hypothetical protein BHU72_04675 [Desulfuribacillus stibiiarsenatis]
MKWKGILAGVFFIVGISAIFYYVERGPEFNHTFNENLLVIEDSVYEVLTEEEISRLQDFARRAIIASNGKPSLYSPHAKFLSNGALLAYMMFVNNTGETVTNLHSMSVKIIGGKNQTIAGGVFNTLKNMPPIEDGNIFLFSVVFHPDKITEEADLSSYMTESFFEYEVAPSGTQSEQQP